MPDKLYMFGNDWSYQESILADKIRYSSMNYPAAELRGITSYP
jgi:hypothetical protein